jgi:hypothetical protein
VPHYRPRRLRLLPAAENAGVGNWAAVPWISVFDPAITTGARKPLSAIFDRVSAGVRSIAPVFTYDAKIENGAPPPVPSQEYALSLLSTVRRFGNLTRADVAGFHHQHRNRAYQANRSRACWYRPSFERWIWMTLRIARPQNERACFVAREWRSITKATLHSSLAKHAYWPALCSE